MARTFLKMATIALLTACAYGQSLGDVARANREKKQAEDAPAAQPKVIRNADLPKDPDAKPEAAEVHPEADAKASSKAADHRAAHQQLAEERAAEQWKSRILAQKYKTASLQAQIDQINASLRPMGSVQSEGPYNRYQARQLNRAAQIQRQLDEQNRRLEEMQEAARRAGMHTAVYDP